MGDYKSTVNITHTFILERCHFMRPAKMKTLFLLVSFVELGSLSSFFNLDANDIQGSKVEFSQFEGKVVLVVNVASQCGYTDGHYRFNFVKLLIMIQCQSSNTDGHLNHCNYFSI